MAESTALVWHSFRPIGSLVRPDRKPSRGLHVVRDADEWTRHWAGPSSGQPFRPPVPAVDWQTEICVVVALGTCPSSEYFVHVDAISVVGDQMTVQAWEIRPGPGGVALCVITHPFDAVAVPAHAGTVNLVKRIAYSDYEAADD